MIHLISFTDQGQALAETLARELDGQAVRCGRGNSLQDWTREHFQTGNVLIFVGAAGIAVRVIAPYVDSKTTDPAVAVVDETGRFAIPLLSGHLGGANDLAQNIAAVCGAVPVITTATDLHGVFAVDQWAKQQNCAVLNPEGIKKVSGALLAGGTVEICSPWPVAGEPPEGVSLRLMPKIAVLGVGCKRGATQETLEEAFAALPVHPASFRKVCTIDLKQDEPGLLAFCRAHCLELETFSAARLQAAPGNFFASEFVEQVTGVDNVCERAAVLGSGGTLCLKKRANLMYHPHIHCIVTGGGLTGNGKWRTSRKKFFQQRYSPVSFTGNFCHFSSGRVSLFPPICIIRNGASTANRLSNVWEKSLNTWAAILTASPYPTAACCPPKPASALDTLRKMLGQDFDRRPCCGIGRLARASPTSSTI